MMRRSSSNKTSKRRCDDSKNKHRRRTSSRQRRFLSSSHFKEITFPHWDSICPNVDQILSNKHSQSGVYAHEVHLVQQELEAVLSMAIVRENFLHSTSDEDLRSNLLQHKEAENIYSSKKTPAKPLPPLVPISHQRQNGPQVLLDRQVSISPVVGTRLDKIWTDLNTYYRKISSNDILMIENLRKFNDNFEEQLRDYQHEYRTQLSTETDIRTQLNADNFHQLIDISQVNSLTTHYLNRTALGRIHNQFSERLSAASNLQRLSPRLRASTFDSSLDFSERLQFVRDSLTDQHPILLLPPPAIDKVKRKRKHSSDEFDSKLSTLIALAHECSVLNQCALKRARLRSTSEQAWQKLHTIEHDLENLLEKFESTGDGKGLHKVEQLLKDWKKYEDDYHHQLEQLE